MKNKLFLIILITSLGIGTVFANEEDSLITIHAIDTNLPDLLSILAAESGFNIVTGPNVENQENFNSKLVIEGILLTMVDKRNSLSALDEKDVREHFGETVYNTTIPRNVKVSEAPSHGKPAILYDVNSAGSVAYIDLAREIINKQGLINE